MENTKKTKQLPFNTEHFLDIVGDASRRSRQFLLLLVFSGILIFIAVANSFVPKYNWFTSRIQIQKNINRFILFNDENNASRVKSLSEFIIENEKVNGVNIDSVYLIKNNTYLKSMDSIYSTKDYIYLTNPKFTPIFNSKFSGRNAKYIEIGNAIKYIKSHYIYSKNDIKDLSIKLDETKIEHLDLVRVPILGVSFDVNYLGIYSGLILATLYFLLYFSLVREYLSLKIAFKRGWTDIKHHHYYFYEYVSMLQVLSIPQKLFSAYKKANIFYIIFPFLAIIFPTFVFIIVYLYDLNSFGIGLETNRGMTIISTTFSSLLLIVIVVTNVFVLKIWRKMDIFWNNQTYEFNFEFILESIGEDRDIDLLDFSDGKLGVKNLEQVKSLWLTTITNFINNTNKITKNNCMKMFGQFINNVLNGEMPIQEHTIETESLINANWNLLLNWYKQKGRKNIGSGFRDGFYLMVLEVKSAINASTPMPPKA